MTGKRLSKIFLTILLAVGFIYRFYGLKQNFSFWSDENVVAIFTRAILERGEPILTTGYSSGIYQWLQYFLSAVSAKVLGLNEFSVRFPSIIFGVLTIWAVYLLGREFFGEKIGLVSAIFTTFLKIEILWSRQARPYQALQLFYLLSVYFVYKLAKRGNPVLNFLGFLASCCLASLMHGLGMVLFLNGSFYLLLSAFSFLKRNLVLLGILIFGVIIYLSKSSIFATLVRVGSINNFFYYRVFLIHNYLPFVIFACLGGFFLLINKKYQLFILLSIFLGVQTVIVSFVLGQPFLRYFYPVIPLIILLSTYGVFGLSRIIVSQLVNSRAKTHNLDSGVLNKAVRCVIPSVLILFQFYILYKKDKISLFPQKFYSLNSDMQEIPEVDWKKIYGYVEENFKKESNLILVTNWNDFPIWYLGEKASSRFTLVRKKGQNNQERDFAFGEKMIYSLEDFKLLIKINKNGIAIFDSWDDQIADGVQEYCQNNLRVVMKVDRLYPVQPRYWTVWVYSWGME